MNPKPFSLTPIALVPQKGFMTEWYKVYSFGKETHYRVEKDERIDSFVIYERSKPLTSRQTLGQVRHYIKSLMGL